MLANTTCIILDYSSSLFQVTFSPQAFETLAGDIINSMDVSFIMDYHLQCYLFSV